MRALVKGPNEYGQSWQWIVARAERRNTAQASTTLYPYPMAGRAQSMKASTLTENRGIGGSA